jgi:hypothetical protein
MLKESWVLIQTIITSQYVEIFMDAHPSVVLKVVTSE